MKLRDFLSTATTSPEAVDEICRDAEAFVGELDGPPDLAVLFVTSHHRSSYADIGRRVAEATGAKHLIGCSAESIVGERQEIERSPGISLLLARLPGAEIESFHTTWVKSEQGQGFRGLPDAMTVDTEEPRLALLLADPFTFPADALLRSIQGIAPKLAFAGGMASAATSAGQNALYLGDKIHDRGAVGVLFRSGVKFANVVSQGCRPIGRRYVVTDASERAIRKLGGVDAKASVRALLDELPEGERFRFEQGPFIGVVMDEAQDDFKRGDFLVRNVLGWHPDGALAIADQVRRGQTVQFQIRDAEAATEDLENLLAKEETREPNPAGGLLFTCNGRGTRLFDRENHDADAIRERFGDIPLAGFFAGGEIGPVGSRNFVHGFTASLVLFTGASEPDDPAKNPSP